MSALRNVAALFVLAAASQVSGLELARSGKPAATIVVAAKAHGVERFAASELQAFVEKMSGARLPIQAECPKGKETVVLVGLDAARTAGGKAAAAASVAELRDDGFAVTRVDDGGRDCLLLLGKMPRGTLYAVYNLLETALGCGFFADGDSVPRRADVVLGPVNLVANPVFATRAYWVPRRVYGPKRFQAALWDIKDWQAFLRWMAKKKMNSLGVSFTSADGAWGEAFLAAFPEAARFQRESLPPEPGAAAPSYTARMGWGLSPNYTTSLLRQVFDYARQTLGLEVVYLFSLGEFDHSLEKAYPKLKWQPPTVLPPFPRVAAAGRCLSPTDPKCRELQRRLWKAIVQAYGTDHRYVVSSQAPPDPLAPVGKSENATLLALEVLREVDPEARMSVPTWEAEQWGAKAWNQKEFLTKLPPGADLLYFHTSFAEDGLRETTGEFAGLPFSYACAWGGGAGNDLFENRFGCLRNQFRLLQKTPKPNAVGFWNWNEARRVNPLMDELCAEFAWSGLFIWRGEGASTNIYVRRYLERRYAPRAALPMAEAWKQVMRGAPRADALVNYRAYSQWSNTGILGVAAARRAVVLAIDCKEVCKDSPFYGTDLVDIGRNYLHQFIQGLARELLHLAQRAKDAAQARRYSPEAKAEAMAEFAKLEAAGLAAHRALTSLLATRRDMCLDDAILEAAATPGANKDLARAIREHQSGLLAEGYGLTDSVEYHQQLRVAQLRFTLDQIRSELTAPTDKPIPPWQAFFQEGATKFILESQPVPYEKKAGKARPSQILEEFLKTVE